MTHDGSGSVGSRAEARPVDGSQMLHATAEADAAPLEDVWDLFGSDGRSGTGHRHVIDVEGRVSLDHGALRLAPNRREGWARQGLSYGPFTPRPGLTFAVHLLNGHNGSHSGPIDGGLRRRFTDWALGPRDRSLRTRFGEFLRSGRKMEAVWLWRWWLRRSPRLEHDEPLDDNLVVGWFDDRAPLAPLADGRCLAVRTNDGETGRVVATVGRGDTLTALPRLLNVPTCYLVVLAPGATTYYAASLPDVDGLAALPEVRPLAIDRRASASGDQVFAGVHQSVLGQVGFSADTRIYGAAIRTIPEWSRPWTSAHVADLLRGEGELTGSRPDHGPGEWTTLDDAHLERTAEGARPVATRGGARIDAPEATGLVVASVAVGSDGSGGVLFRARDDRNFWRATVTPTGGRVDVVVDGASEAVAAADLGEAHGADRRLLQVADDGIVIRAHLDGLPITTVPIRDERLTDATGVGVLVSGTDSVVTDFEAHPRAVRVPDAVRLPELPCPVGSKVVLGDHFGGPRGDLDGSEMEPGRRWRRVLGTGEIEVLGDGSARVRASREAPNPGRTLYVVPCSGLPLVDLDVEVTPPGTSRGQGHQGRGGVVFWQDHDHFVIVNNWLDDSYPGASISMFCRLGPFEDIFRAVWSNVGGSVAWGRPHRLRVAFDGTTLVARVDGEIVLYRTIQDVHADASPIEVRGIGLAVNWEWGNDTGTAFRDLVVRSN